MTKAQAEELEDKFIFAVLLLIFYATITKKDFSFAPPSELAAQGFLGRGKRIKEKKNLGIIHSPSSALKGGQDFCATLQRKADRAQESLVPKKALQYTGNITQGSSKMDLEYTLLFPSLVGHS